VELPSQDEVKGEDFVSSEVVLLAGGIRNEVEEEFEEGPLVVVFRFLCECALEDIDDGLDGVIKEDIRVVAGNQLITDYDKF
jgi:hypothetical protein